MALGVPQVNANQRSSFLGPLTVVTAGVGTAIVALGFDAIGSATTFKHGGWVVAFGAALMIVAAVEFGLLRHERREATQQEAILTSQRQDFIAALTTLGDGLRGEMARLFTIFDGQGAVYTASLHEFRENKVAIESMNRRLAEIERQMNNANERVRLIERRFGG